MNKIYIVTGPSGIGKSYLGTILHHRADFGIIEVKLFTTRKPRINNTADSDRLVVSEKEFKHKNKNGDFIVSGKFNNNWYGYPKSIIRSNQPVVINTWPAMIPKFAVMKNTVVIGLTTSPTNLKLLKLRLLERGDSLAQVEQRMQLIQADIKLIEQNHSLIEEHGKLFYVDGDNTISQVVIPWIINDLKT